MLRLAVELFFGLSATHGLRRTTARRDLSFRLGPKRTLPKPEAIDQRGEAVAIAAPTLNRGLMGNTSRTTLAVFTGRLDL